MLADIDHISDEEVRRVLAPLGANTFTRAYVEAMGAACDAPLVYHLGCALALLATAIPMECSIDSPGAPLHGNLYVLLSGAPGTARKTTTISQARRIAQEVIPDRIGLNPGSQEGLLRGLANAPHQLQFYGDFSTFLTSSTNSRHLAPLRSGLLDAYDNGAISKILSGETLFVPATRLSMLAACTPSTLTTHLSAQDVGSGFLGRFLVLPGHRTRWVEPAALPDHVLATLSGMLRHRAMSMPLCRVRVQGTPVAPAMADWSRRTDKRQMADSRIGADAASRVGQIAYKLGLLLTLDVLAPRLPEGSVPGLAEVSVNAQMEAFAAATTLADLHARSVRTLAASLAPRPDMILSQAVRTELLRSWLVGESPNEGDLTRRVGCLLTKLKPILQTLLVEQFAVTTHTVVIPGSMPTASQVANLYGPGHAAAEALNDLRARMPPAPPNGDDTPQAPPPPRAEHTDVANDAGWATYTDPTDWA